MLDLRKDLYVRLALSACKDRSLNKPFKVVHADKWDDSSLRNFEMPSEFEQVVENLPLPRSNNTNNVFAPTPSKPVEKIDEKVEKIIADPVLLEIKAELEFAEALLQKIKTMDKYNAKIPAIEQTVSRLKQMLDQKMYV